jgi:glycosyltransferase involved in cell wall biosynthesis
MVSVAPKIITANDSLLDPSASHVTAQQQELRILQVFSVLGMGGAETWLMSLLKYFNEHGDQLPLSVKFDILLTGATKSIFDDEAKDLGARLFYVPFTRRNMAGFVREFRRILAEGNYDAIHDHQDYIAGLHFFMGSRQLPPIRIAHIHNPLYQRNQYANDRVRRAANSFGKRLLGRFATHIMGTSRQIVTEYGLDKSHSTGITVGAVHCGFDVTKFQGDHNAAHVELCREFGWDESVKILLFVGRLEADEVVHLGQRRTHKNPAFALDVVRECTRKDDKIRLLMVGGGEAKRREFEDMVTKWDLASKVALAGIRHDVPRIMRGSDLLLFPSLAEGLGMVVVEAQAAGLKVLASDTTPHEAVVNRYLVEFVPLRNSAEEWADTALRFMDLAPPDARECNELVRLSPFSIENSANKLLHIYNTRQHSDGYLI